MAFTTRQKIITVGIVTSLFVLTFSAVALTTVGKSYIYPLFKKMKAGISQSEINEKNRPINKNDLTETSFPVAPNDPLIRQSKTEQTTLTISFWESIELKDSETSTFTSYPPTKKPETKSPIEVTYPLKARRFGWEGTTSLEVEISPIGEINDIEIISGSGYTILDEAAIKAVRKTTFIPGSSTNPMKLICSVEFLLK